MEFYPEGCCEKLGKTFASIDEIKNAMIKTKLLRARFFFVTGSIIYILI